MTPRHPGPGRPPPRRPVCRLRGGRRPGRGVPRRRRPGARRRPGRGGRPPLRRPRPALGRDAAPLCRLHSLARRRPRRRRKRRLRVLGPGRALRPRPHRAGARLLVRRRQRPRGRPRRFRPAARAATAVRGLAPTRPCGHRRHPRPCDPAPRCVRSAAPPALGHGARHPPRRRRPPDDARPRPGGLPGHRGRPGLGRVPRPCVRRPRCSPGHEARRRGPISALVRRSRADGRVAQLEPAPLVRLRDAVLRRLPPGPQTRALERIMAGGAADDARRG